MSKYNCYLNPTKELLDSVKVGDLIKINDWKKPMKVKVVTESYFAMAYKVFGAWVYSVCEKKPWDGMMYNAMRGGMFHCSRDNMIFGAVDFDYNFDDEVAVEKYLRNFETGEIELSARAAIPINVIRIKVELKEGRS